MYKYLFISCMPVLAFAQSQWLNTTSDSLFSTPANWSPSGVPASGSNLVIGASGYLGFDNGGNYTALSINVAPGIESIFAPFGTESVTIGSGGLSLGAGSSIVFELPVLTTSSSSWSIGAASVAFSGVVDIQPGTVSINVGNGGSISFDGASSLWTGTLAITGSGSFSITATGFNTNNLDNMTINGSPVGLSGDDLVPIPEPGSAAAFAGLLALVGGIYRRRK